jgi:hypothetical protein
MPMVHENMNMSTYLPYGFKEGAQVGRQAWSVRYQGELLGLWDPQNRDLILVENHP